MSKRSEDAALKAYPPKFVTQKRHPKRMQSEKVDVHAPVREIFRRAYQQAEKDTIERAVEWLEKSLQFGVHPCSGASFIEQFKREMEEDNG